MRLSRLSDLLGRLACQDGVGRAGIYRAQSGIPWDIETLSALCRFCMCDDAIRIRACRALAARVRIGDPMPGQKHQIEFAANLVTRIRRVKRRHESVEPDFITDC